MKPLCFFIICFFFSNTPFSQLKFESELNTGINLTQNTFTDIPLMPGEEKIDIFLPGEKPKEDYYKVRIIEVNGAGTYNDLLAALQKKAQAEGFDGLLLLGKNNYAYHDYSVGGAVASGIVAGLTNQKETNYRGTIITGESVSAVGLKYKSKMKYIENIIKQATVYFNDTLNTKYEIPFLMNGVFKELGESESGAFYLKNISLFNKADTFISPKIKDLGINDGNETFVGAKMYTDSGNIKYFVSYSANGAFNEVKIKMPASQNFVTERNYSVVYYVNNNKISKRYIKAGRHNKTVYTDVYNYEDDKLNGFTRYNATGNEKIFTVKYSFFTSDDLPATASDK